MPQPIRVFISSPGDVADERNLARRLLKDELPFDPFLRGKVTLDPVSWDDPAAPTPMVATLTPQEAVNRFCCQPSECDIVIVILWSRLGTHLDLGKFQKNGEPYLSGTEYEYEDAINSPRQPPPIVLVYRRTEEPTIRMLDPEFDHKREQYRRAQAFFDRFKNPGGSYRGGFTDYATPTDFATRMEKDLKAILQKLVEAAPSQPTAVVVEPIWRDSPYPGLRPFDVTEAAIFFGRGRETDILIGRLRDPNQRFLAVVGSSGSGKSSLIRAGLLPRLAEGAIEGSSAWRALLFKPGSYGDNPFLALASALNLFLSPNRHGEPITIAETLGNAPARITEYIDQALAGAPAQAQCVIFVDQLEELFARTAEEAHRKSFIHLLAEATGHPRGRILATLRADFLPQATRYPKLANLLRTSTFVLGPPGHASLTDMIRRPAQLAGVVLDESLTDEILKDAGNDPGALPLVAFCLDELYRSSGAVRQLTTPAYEELGRLHGAIGRRVKALLQGEGVDSDTALPTLFQALVRVDAAGNVARRPAFRGELPTCAPLPKLVEKLIQGRLLLAEDADDRAAVTLAHESLFAAWPALRDWVGDNCSKLQRLHRVLLSLGSIEPIDRTYAVRALGEMGPVSPEVVPALIAVLGDANEGVRSASATALGQIGPSTAEAIPALTALLGDVYVVRRTAIAALGQIGPAAVSALVAALGQGNERRRWSAAEALGKIEPAAVPALIVALGNAHEEVRSAATTALERIGPAAADAIPALTSALQDSHQAVATGADRALRKIQSSPI